MKIDLHDLNTWGIFATFIGLAISIITLVVAENARRATKKLQNSLIFDKRVPVHLNQISNFLSDFNTLLNNTNGNVNQIKLLLAHVKSELLSLLEKITDKRARKLISMTISHINKNISRPYSKVNMNESSTLWNRIVTKFTKSTGDSFWSSYTDIGEVHRTVDNLYKDKKVKIKT